ncbi:unnamed protein product [Prunus armeniaca]
MPVQYWKQTDFEIEPSTRRQNQQNCKNWVPRTDIGRLHCCLSCSLHTWHPYAPPSHPGPSKKKPDYSSYRI